MYEMLLRADLVIADISTGNANALYELGVRHALRPYSTIIMRESKGKFYFDLNHTSTFSYEHMGEDIGAKEARRAVGELSLLIQRILENPLPDSPVYTFIPRLIQPHLSDEQFEALIQRSEASEERFSEMMSQGAHALREDRYADAMRFFSSAVEMKPEEAYLKQQLALATYKSKEPSEIASLVNALKVINDLGSDDSNDPETLGIAGAIHKRLWSITKDTAELNLAIKYYGRGFEFRKDYYNGENYALCMNYRAEIEEDKTERGYYEVGARKAREDIVDILIGVIQSPQFGERSDQKWVVATLANTLFGLNREAEAGQYERQFYEYARHGGLAQWERDTYEQGKQEVLRITGRPAGRRGKRTGSN
ncbi:TRAFs-binding domain-containing protein [Burkholderia cenocepacia]|uniref:TRAFs-binding domain-containing protein n=1 Tax=Burkholderia cenocepacia TaxID=95486 RepID=UPI000AD7AA5E|nr:TRAFs-binding domain-containing protein [Burkholderia cenocepacia]